jgi:transmembrane sensor
MQDPSEFIPGQERAAELIAKHLRGELSGTEKEELDAWISTAGWHKTWFEQCTNPVYLDQLMGDYHKAASLEADLRAEVGRRMGYPSEQDAPAISPVQRTPFLRTAWFRVAAAVIIIIAGTVTWFRYSRSVPGPAIATKQSQPIPPGRQGAILTLADGKQLTLDSLQNGVVAEQNGSQAAVVDGQLAYHPITTAVQTITYNTITTPRGRQYQLVLPDGTKVWLNAASRITFPTVFNGAERKVSLSGEAYFEVARNAEKPFKISAGGADVDILGTRLNIAAYNDEKDIKATLLEGSIKVSSETSPKDSKAHTELILKPGQQAVVSDHLQLNEKADIEKVIAWKNGLFDFNPGTDIFPVMQQLSRWYDIDVRYEGKVPDIKVWGKMDKGLSLNEILEFLTKMNVKCKLSGRTVIVSDH